MSTSQPYIFSGINDSNGKPLTVLGHVVHHVIFYPSNSTMPNTNMTAFSLNPSSHQSINSTGANILVVPNNQLNDWIRGLQPEISSTQPTWLNRNQLAQVKSNNQKI